MALREVQVPSRGAIVDDAEERQQLRPRPESLIHRVGVQSGILAQALVEPRERVVADERFVVREHPALLGVQEEDEAQEDREQGVVHAVGVFPELVPEELTPRGVIRSLEAAQEFVERVEHLLREPLADLVLVLAAVIEQGGQAFTPGERQEPTFGQQQTHRGTDGATCRGEHVGNLQIQPARGLTPGRRDEPQ